MVAGDPSSRQFLTAAPEKRTIAETRRRVVDYAMNHALDPIPAFTQPEPPSQGELGEILGRARRAGIAPERVLLALGYPPDYAPAPRTETSDISRPAGG
jgi:hypothetical protein